MLKGFRYGLFFLLTGALCAQAQQPSHRKAGMAPVPQSSATVPFSPSAQPAQTPLSTRHQMDPVPAQTLQIPPASTQAPGTEKIPASAPRVSFSNNELTVVAQNSSLGEILNAIRAATGMKVDGPSASADRVTAKIGPAPVRDVLLSLLEGSRLDFAILGSATDPTVVERLVLSARSTGGDTNYASATQQPQPTEPSDSASSDDDDNPGFAQPATAAPAQPVKTPEQLLEDLKKLEADRAQQQQQQNNTAPANPNARPSRPERPK